MLTVCRCYSLQAFPDTKTDHTAGWGEKSISYCCEAVLNTNNGCQAQSAGGERQRAGWTSAADIVREMEGEGEMTLQRGGRDGGRCSEEERTIQARGDQNSLKTCLHSQTENVCVHTAAHDARTNML